MSLIFGRNKSDSQDSTSNKEQTIGSTALQQAIERNRLKLLEKGPLLKSSNSPSPESTKDPIPAPNPVNRPPSIPIEEKLKQLRVDPPPNMVLPTSRPIPPSPPVTPGPSFLGIKAQNSNPVSPSNIGRGGIESAKLKWENIKSNTFNYFLKGMWIFSIILLFRLIFADRGVLEYYFRRKKVQEKLETLENQVQINKKLTKEIARIQKDTTFQKSLVRNHLGFIADDEFILVLPESKIKL